MSSHSGIHAGNASLVGANCRCGKDAHSSVALRIDDDRNVVISFEDPLRTFESSRDCTAQRSVCLRTRKNILGLLTRVTEFADSIVDVIENLSLRRTVFEDRHASIVLLEGNSQL